MFEFAFSIARVFDWWGFGLGAADRVFDWPHIITVQVRLRRHRPSTSPLSLYVSVVIVSHLCRSSPPSPSKYVSVVTVSHLCRLSSPSPSKYVSAITVQVRLRHHRTSPSSSYFSAVTVSHLCRSSLSTMLCLREFSN
ncbi:hypothetical protein ACSQ67_000803 [Phaseolus vulgaris]